MTHVHPGTYVRKEIIPEGVTVTAAAKRLGVGRPALSNFLNGKAALSSEMAVRLEKAFGADRKTLLDLQSKYDQEMRREEDKEVAVRRFVPSFLTIKARQVEDWADSLGARSELAVLLRRLVHSTGDDLRHVDFPGYDNAQRKGVDGFVEAGAATPWVAEGKSYWEFGTSKDPGSKANKDYRDVLKKVEPEERTTNTFVFVTPRNWPGKTAWEKEKNKAGDWKAVRAFDASDLEQWLEQSVPGQISLAEFMGLSVDGYETLEQAWSRWVTASEPQLTHVLFSPSVDAHRGKFKNWLDKPSESFFVVAADSRDEALAFLACLFDQDELRQYRDLSAVFTSPQRLRTLLASEVPFIPIVHAEATECELADAYRRLHCIVLHPRNAVGSEADISLDLLTPEDFDTALTAMGVDRGEIDRLARESGRSPTILRRRLSKNAAIRTPSWASDDDIARRLVPMALIGAWHADGDADRAIVACLANGEYEAIEVEIARLLGFDDSPVWSAGQYRGVVSKIDALFGVARIVTRAHLDRFFEVAETVLSESDPALELPEEDRWAAALYSKTRGHSNALREGISETLVLLSVHGNNLFQRRLGIDVEGRVAVLIRRLLTPLTVEKLLSHDDDLPRYAEAAPDEFLRIIEDDLRQSDPTVLDLLKPVDSGSLWARPRRTGILWAMECLAWNPRHLPRVSAILANLCERRVEDNWANKPSASLQAIFRSWMPQTAASVEQRLKALEMLSRRFPDVAWQIQQEQLRPGSRVGHYSYRPRWRSDASGAGHPVTRGERWDFERKALDNLLGWEPHNEETLGDLVEILQRLSEKDEAKVWALVSEWSQQASDGAKAKLRETIRRFAFSRRGHQELGEASRDRAREVYLTLRPSDLLVRHGWLFAKTWVEYSAHEIEDDRLAYEKHEEWVKSRRREALAEVLTERGFDGVSDMLPDSEAAHIVGQTTALCLSDLEPRIDFVRFCLSIGGGLRGKAEQCLGGFLWAVGDEACDELLRTVAEGQSDEDRKRLFVCAPFRGSTWQLLDKYDDEIRLEYWRDVYPSWNRHSPAEFAELIDRLLEVGRPRAAFNTVHMDFEDIETARLYRLLQAVATVDVEPRDHYQLDPFYLDRAVGSLDRRGELTRDEMAQIEFLFIEALDRGSHGIPNLENQVVESPALFVQAVALVYRRRDDGEDPPEWGTMNSERRTSLASPAYRLLGNIRKIPGTNEEGKIDAADLRAWLRRVRRLCREYGRAVIGDQCIGQMLARAPEGEDGRWPCEAVCEVMEEIASTDIGTGFHVAVHNSRGVYSRGWDEGGQQERELAAKYRGWSEQLLFDFPYVAGLLEDVAASYEREAARQDSEATITKRLH